ncbi:MAG: sel1 repeat family protein [Thiopseudomonas sp.]|nr:sel1 repeat family protein [Thiopseudomonas sp.]MCK9466255.1 sel1 repeat family protein [Thiopseudomonas sp.]
MIFFKRTFLSIALALFSLSAQAENDDSPMLIDTPARICTLSQDSSNLASDFNYCIQLAELGYDYAQYELGNYWYDGVLTEQNYSEAIRWYSQASMQGHPEAQLRLGLMYAKGQGAAVNKAQAFIILKMAAINGSDEAYNEADRLILDMETQELELANQVLSQIFRKYLQHIQDHNLEQLLTP